MGDDGQHMDNQVSIEHIGADTTSDTHFRSTMDGASRGVFNGRILVHEHAVRTDAQLRNDNLLLTDRAEINTKPELEIYTDDVKCSHGATTGQINPLELFYLRARGIPEAEAKQVLITAFARAVLRRIQQQDVAQRLESLMGEPDTP